MLKLFSNNLFVFFHFDLDHRSHLDYVNHALLSSLLFTFLKNIYWDVTKSI